MEVSPLNNTLLLPVLDASQVGEARRGVTTLAAKVGLDATAAGRAAIVATELATNLARHAGGGNLLARAIKRREEDGLELLAVDRGAGVSDVSRSMRDGYSTGSTPGTGLGAVRRQSQVFDIHSLQAQGTVVLARIFPEGRRPRDLTPRLESGVVCLPARGEEAPGDGWAIEHQAGRSRYFVVDGLGHGPQAAEAAMAAVQVLPTAPEAKPGELIELMHGALRATRGAAAAIAEADWERRLLRFAGIGNIAATIVNPDLSLRSLMSHNGIVGHQMRKVQELDFPWPPGALLVLHSDGLSSNWKASQYPGAVQRHPAILAALLHRDHARGRDDATVLVARDPVRPPAPWEVEG